MTDVNLDARSTGDLVGLKYVFGTGLFHVPNRTLEDESSAPSDLEHMIFDETHMILLSCCLLTMNLRNSLEEDPPPYLPPLSEGSVTSYWFGGWAS